MLLNKIWYNDVQYVIALIYCLFYCIAKKIRGFIIASLTTTIAMRRTQYILFCCQTNYNIIEFGLNRVDNATNICYK